MHVIGLSHEFMQHVPELERQMVLHGLMPSDFSLSRELAPFQPYKGGISEVSYSYNVRVQDQAFTVVLPADETQGDRHFLEYFSRICFAPEDDHLAENRLFTLFARFEEWLKEGSLKIQPKG